MWVTSHHHAWLSAVMVLAATSAHAQPTSPEPPPPVEPWYEALEFGAFADTYFSFNTNVPKPQEGRNLLRAYDSTNGFALSWVGADVSYDPQPVGGTISLRFGPTAQTYANSCFSNETRCDGDVEGLAFVKQAFASWQPVPGLTLDLGKFDTIYGAEVAESQDNLNYSRGAVYWLAQPLFHTGLRTNVRLMPELDLNLLVVNGWNNSIDNNIGKSLGAQAIAQPVPQLSIALGWLGGPEQDDAVTIPCPDDSAYSPVTGSCFPVPGIPASDYIVDRGGANNPEAWRHLADLVVAWKPSGAFSLVFNGDFGVEGVRTLTPAGDTTVDSMSYFGAMLASRYALTEVWALAARAEYFSDPDGYATGYDELKLVTGTLTIEASPTPNLQLRLEGRGDFAVDANVDAAEGEEADIFPAGVRDDIEGQITTTLSAVVRI
jgi:hypothetical protein